MSTTATVVGKQNTADGQVRPLIPAEIAAFVRARREATGWSQDTLASLAGLNIRTVQRVEDGQPSSLDTRRALARAFQFPDLDFFSKAMPVPDEVQIQRLVEQCQKLQAEKVLIEEKMTHLNQTTEAVQMVLNMAAARDVRWLHLVRTTLMPKQDCRVPFHNAAEIAIRGYHCSMRGKPSLMRVTYSPLPYSEGGLHRGYHAGLIFAGAEFAPGVTWAQRFKGAPENGAPDFGNIWRLPNIYFGNHLEVSTGLEDEDGPVSWRGMEFAVRNPEGQLSDWVEFSFDFDDEKLLVSMRRNHDDGMRLLEGNNAEGAVEPFRRAWILSRALFGWGTEEYLQQEAIWNRVVDQAALDKLRFREGARLRIVAGPHAGRAGVVEKLLLRHLHAYLIDADGEKVQAADNQVEVA
jgi:transcriptional regulator with XRE-family HTH domain